MARPAHNQRRPRCDNLEEIPTTIVVYDAVAAIRRGGLNLRAPGRIGYIDRVMLTDAFAVEGLQEGSRSTSHRCG
jgi:hypothetical protein